MSLRGDATDRVGDGGAVAEYIDAVTGNAFHNALGGQLEGEVIAEAQPGERGMGKLDPGIEYLEEIRTHAP
jgi:hypothetical protein